MYIACLPLQSYIFKSQHLKNITIISTTLMRLNWMVKLSWCTFTKNNYIFVFASVKVAKKTILKCTFIVFFYSKVVRYLCKITPFLYVEIIIRIFLNITIKETQNMICILPNFLFDEKLRKHFRVSKSYWVYCLE